MAINPPSDIVNDVARAADPAKYRVAAERLSQMAGAAPESDFGEILNTAMAGPGRQISLDPYTVRTTFRNDTALSNSNKTGAAYQQFEAFVLQSFIESMLPKEAENVFGKGTAGGIWKSMMAEQMAAQIAKAGGVGIAKVLETSHPAKDRVAAVKLNDHALAALQASRPGL